MHFGLSDEQAELAATVRGLLAKRADSTAVRAAMESEAGYDVDLWRTLCDQIGAAALAVPEELGGAGFTFFESAVVLEEVGRSLAPSPLLTTAVVTEALVCAGGEVAAGLLPRVATGEVTALAWDAVTGMPDLPLSLRADPSADGWAVTGSLGQVPYGRQATVLLAVADTSDGPTLFALDVAAATTTATPALDPTTQLARVELDAAPARPVTRDHGVLAHAHRAGAASTVVLQLGLAQRALDMTVAYTRERVQFGRPIGSFQALKHRMADLLVLVETTRSAAWAAAYAVARHSPEAPLLVAAASAYASEALATVAGETIQLHGGIGITWEHDAHLVLKRAHALRQLFGTPARHRATVLAP